MTGEVLTAFSYIIIFLTTALTLFSICFNYDEQKPIKLSKWGWLAVMFSVILAGSNLFVEYAENEKSEVERKITDSIRNELILKSDRLTDLTIQFKDEALSDLRQTQSDMSVSLMRLDSLSNSIDTEFKKVSTTFEETKGALETEISESTFKMPDTFEEAAFLFQILLDSTSRIKSTKVIDSINVRLYFYGPPRSSNMSGGISKNDIRIYGSDTLSFEGEVDLKVGIDGVSFASSLFDLCDGDVRISFSLFSKKKVLKQGAFLILNPFVYIVQNKMEFELSGLTEIERDYSDRDGYLAYASFNAKVDYCWSRGQQ